MRYLGALVIVAIGASGAAADDRVDVNLAVDVDVHVVPPPPPRADPMRAWMAVSGAFGFNESGFRVQLDLRRGLLGHTANGQPLYGVIGVAGSRGYSTADDFMTQDHLGVTDDRATFYAGIGGREGRIEARWFVGAGVERSVGTLRTQDGFMFDANRISPVAELGGEVFVRIVGRAGLMFGGRVTGHFQQYLADEIGASSWWRAPGLEGYGGVAMLTE